jgi:cell shape-determining protein MreD
MTPPGEDPYRPLATAHDLHIVGAFVLCIGVVGDMYEGKAWGISCLATAAVIFGAATLLERRDQGQNRGPGLDDHPG